MNTSNTARLSLPRGTKVTGRGHTYTVGDILTRSSRSTTVSCRDEAGNTYRLKYYNGQTVITEAVLRQFAALHIPRTVVPVDTGVYNSLCFAVFKKYPVTSADQYPVSADNLVKHIIPQLVTVIRGFHAKRIVIRDLEPSHILIDTKTNSAAFCGIGNPLQMPEKVTRSKAPGYGVPETFLAPETEQHGYGTASDYFALGMTLLSLVKGSNPAKGLTRADFLAQLKKGNIPGIDLQHLRSTPYHLYSEEDRIMYLICGLLQPDYQNRWGIGELNCWLNRQHIPIVQKGKRIQYQFNKPFTLKGRQCWNTAQIVNILVQSGELWTNQTASAIVAFIKKQKLSCADAAEAFVGNSAFSGEGKIFRIVYTLLPSLDKLWWKGEAFSDMTSLTEAVRKNPHEKSVLSELLKNRCLSFFVNVRAGKAAGPQCSAAELSKIEEIEIAEQGKGVERCIMRFASDKSKRAFSIDGKQYYSFDDLINSPSMQGVQLKKKSKAVLSDQSFQAWMWANGLEEVARNALNIAKRKPEKSFFFLLRLCEQYAKEESTRKAARNIYLHYGDYAPIVWLTENISQYEPTSSVFQSIYDKFDRHPMGLDLPLEELVKKCSAMVTDYQSFVSNTHNNPFSYENGDVSAHGIAPKCESCYFCCKWNGDLEVSPQFLYTQNETPDAAVISAWLDSSRDGERDRLNGLIGQLNHFSVTRFSSGEEYKKYCQLNQWLASFMMILCILITVLAVLQMRTFKLSAIPFGVLAILYPFTAFSWYYRKNVCVSIWLRNKGDSDSTEHAISEKLDRLGTRTAQIQNAIIQKRNATINVAPIPIVSGSQSNSALEELDLPVGQRVLAYTSLISLTILFGMTLEWNVTDAVTLIVKSFFYVLQYGCALPFFITNKNFINSCKAFAITAGCLMLGHLAGFLMFGAGFLVVVDYIPLVLAGIALVLFILAAFL